MLTCLLGIILEDNKFAFTFQVSLQVNVSSKNSSFKCSLCCLLYGNLSFFSPLNRHLGTYPKIQQKDPSSKTTNHQVFPSSPTKIHNIHPKGTLSHHLRPPKISAVSSEISQTLRMLKDARSETSGKAFWNCRKAPKPRRAPTERMHAARSARTCFQGFQLP